MKLHGALFLVVVGCLLGGCPKEQRPTEPGDGPTGPSTGEPTLATPKTSTAAPSSSARSSDPIGSATMEEDGTIVLMLRAEGPGGIRGDAQFRYPRSHPRYQKVLDHLGGLRPGESKPVPPWPDED